MKVTSGGERMTQPPLSLVGWHVPESSKGVVA